MAERIDGRKQYELDYALSNAGSGGGGGSGTVTSVAFTAPTGLLISGSPITTSGTLILSVAPGYEIPTTSSKTQWDSAYTDRLKWDGSASGLVASTGRTSLGLGGAAVLNVGTTAGTVAAGDDARFSAGGMSQAQVMARLSFGGF